jgi:isocitrate/isopropylmalate dehydrogenase
MARTITLIPGDGIGPEVTDAVVRILDATGVAIEWDRQLAGVLAVERTGQTLPVELVDSIRRNKVALKGPVTTPVAHGIHQRQRRASQGAGFVRKSATGLESAGRPGAISVGRPRHRAREH